MDGVEGDGSVVLFVDDPSVDEQVMNVRASKLNVGF